MLYRSAVLSHSVDSHCLIWERDRKPTDWTWIQWLHGLSLQLYNYANYFSSILNRYCARLLGSLAHGSLSGPASILVDLVVSSSFIALEHLDLLGRHQAGYHIGLDLLELETETLVRVVFFICLVLPVSTWDNWGQETYLVVEDQWEVRVFGCGVEDDRDEGVDGCLLRDQVEGPSLVVSTGWRCRVEVRTCLFLNWIKVSSFLMIS